MTTNKKNVLITGSSTGIGLATAEALTKNNYTVYACARKPEDLARLENEVGAHPVKLDVTVREDIDALENFLSKEASDGLFALINNAGIVRHGPVECVPMSELREQFEVNLFGQVAVTQKALPYIRKTKGRIVNISSISGRSAAPFLGPYAASKFALEAINDSLRREMIVHGVHVSSINPGFIKTPILTKQRDKKELEELFFTRPGQKEAYLPGLEQVGKYFQSSIPNADPVEWVVEAVLHALESPRPKTRYYVGKGISFAALMYRLLPDRWMDRILWKHLRK
ncbi:MAG: SDR family oxidoreductase [Thermodesulfobacteriota bacterium]